MLVGFVLLAIIVCFASATYVMCGSLLNWRALRNRK